LASSRWVWQHPDGGAGPCGGRRARPRRAAGVGAEARGVTILARATVSRSPALFSIMATDRGRVSSPASLLRLRKRRVGRRVWSFAAAATEGRPSRLTPPPRKKKQKNQQRNPTGSLCMAKSGRRFFYRRRCPQAMPRWAPPARTAHASLIHVPAFRRNSKRNSSTIG